MDNPRGADAIDEMDGLAARALAYLAADEERFADFLALTGLTIPTLRGAAGQAGFARGILSYVIADEDLFIRFCAAEEAKPELLARAIHRAIGQGETGAL